MLIPKTKENYKKRKNLGILKKKYFIFLIFIVYSCGLVLLVSNKNKLFEIIKNKIPIPTRMIIKDSIPYQFYKSNFNFNFPYNYLIGLTQKVDPIYLDIKFKNMRDL